MIASLFEWDEVQKMIMLVNIKGKKGHNGPNKQIQD